MLLRFCSAVVIANLVASLFLAPATAQVVRFDTNVGTFDLELNPTGHPDLQGHVDNILSYVESGRYDLTVINRAAEGFVMQMGGFQLDTLFLPSAFSAFDEVSKDAPVIVDAENDGSVDFDLTGLENTRGTVSLALGSNTALTQGSNTGTSSFFINLGTNTSLDDASLRFVPFAKVLDMATIDLIMGLEQANLSDGGLAADDIPLLDANRLVFVERAFVLANELNVIADVLPESLEGEGLSDLLSNSSTSLTVPEPAALMLAAGALLTILAMKPRRS